MTKEELRQLIGLEVTIQSAAEKERYRKIMRQHGLDPNSYYQELEMSSPCIDTHRDISYSYEAMALHSHAFYEIICCRTSCNAEFLVASHRYALQKGDILLIRPGTSHCAILPDPLRIPYERDIIWINDAYLRKIMSLNGVAHYTGLPAYLIRTANTQWEFLCDMIHSGVREEEKKQPAWQISVMGNTLYVISHLYRACFSQSAQPLKAEQPELLDGIITYINAHYTEKIVMSEIGKKFFVSERTISTLFRQRLGTTFYHFLTQRRLIAAKSLIQAGNTLESAAEQTGFTDYSSFYRAFKQEFGISPRQFRKNAPSTREAMGAAHDANQGINQTKSKESSGCWADCP